MAEGNFVQFLPDFPLLSHLTVDNKWWNHADAELLMFPTIEACAELISFQFLSNRPIPGIQAEQLLNSTTYTNKLEYLKSVKVEVPTLTKSYMQYITTYIPIAQLDAFQPFMSYKVKFSQWIQGDDDTGTTLKFAI